MRHLPLVFASLAAIGCTNEPEIGFTLISALPAETAGVALGSDGLASAAMDGQVCLLDVSDASVIGDQDLGDGAEVLLDSHQDKVLTAHEGALYLLSRDLSEPQALTQDAATRARITDDGSIVALSTTAGDCSLSWSSAPDEAWQLPDADCSGPVSLAVDRSTGVAWIGDGQQLTQLHPNGRTATWDIPADRLSFDASTGHVLVGKTGEAWIGAMGPDGEIAWSRDLRGALFDIDSAGATGVTAVMMDQDIGGMLSLVLGDTGQPIADFQLPESAEVSMADDGSMMALARDEEVLFYRVDADDGWLETASTDNMDLKERDHSTALTIGSAAGATLGTALLIATLAD
ncbi:MAG: hypothetical protein KC912_11240 [Proteobacteria bacterium]|nr:hypothetical protein [Pseudomonadota bacterium]